MFDLLATERDHLGNFFRVVNHCQNDRMSVQIDPNVPDGFPPCLAG
jgi:hypothetical protein